MSDSIQCAEVISLESPRHQPDKETSAQSCQSSSDGTEAAPGAAVAADLSGVSEGATRQTLYERQRARETMLLHDPETGQIVNAYFQRARKASYGQPFVVLFPAAFLAVADILTQREMRVFARILSKVGYGDNFVPISGKEIAEATKLSPSAVSRAIGRMKAARILIRSREKDGRQSRYRLNRLLCWRGDAMSYLKYARRSPDGPIFVAKEQSTKLPNP